MSPVKEECMIVRQPDDNQDYIGYVETIQQGIFATAGEGDRTEWR